MKVTNLETLREETRKALNDEFGLDLAPCTISYEFKSIDGQTYPLTYEYSLTNELLFTEFSIIFTDDYLCFRQDGKNHTYIDYEDLKNKTQYYMRLAVIVHELIKG